MKKNIVFVALLAALSLFSCNDNENEDRSFSLIRSGADVYENFLYEDVSITSGSGEYKLELEDNTLADAEIILSESYPFGAVRITGKKIGRTNLTVEDTGWGKSKTIEVRVNEPGIQFTPQMLVPEIVAAGEELILEALTADVKDDPVFDQSYKYLFSRGGKGLLQVINQSSVAELRRFRHEEKGGDIYLVIRSETDEDETDARRLRPLRVEGSAGYVIYTGFFGPYVESRMSYNPPKLIFEEDLTEKYKTLFPDAGVEKVAVFYQGICYYAIFTEGVQ